MLVDKLINKVSNRLEQFIKEEKIADPRFDCLIAAESSYSINTLREFLKKHENSKLDLSEGTDQAVHDWLDECFKFIQKRQEEIVDTSLVNHGTVANKIYHFFLTTLYNQARPISYPTLHEINLLNPIVFHGSMEESNSKIIKRLCGGVKKREDLFDLLMCVEPQYWPEIFNRARKNENLDNFDLKKLTEFLNPAGKNIETVLKSKEFYNASILHNIIAATCLLELYAKDRETKATYKSLSGYVLRFFVKINDMQSKLTEVDKILSSLRELFDLLKSPSSELARFNPPMRVASDDGSLKDLRDIIDEIIFAQAAKHPMATISPML